MPTDWPKLRDRGKRYPEAYSLLEELQRRLEREEEVAWND